MFNSVTKFDHNRHTVANGCACHSVNLYDIHIDVCCPVAITFLVTFRSFSTAKMKNSLSLLMKICGNGEVGLSLRNFF